MAKSTSQFITKLGDDSVPIAHRSEQLIDVLAKSQAGDEKCQEVAQEVFSRLVAQSCDEEVRKKAKMLNDIMKQLENAPMRPATFIQVSDVVGGSSVPHVLVSLDNGEMAYIACAQQDEVNQLSLGDRVMVDGQNKILLHATMDQVQTGPEARFERRVDNRHIEVISHHDEKSVVLASPELMGKVDKKEVLAGSPIVIGGGGRLAVRALPPIDNQQDNFRFLDRGLVPDVVAERDIGAPPKVIGEVARHIREEMVRPELRRRFRLRPCITRLLCGVSGTGKTLAVQAIHRQMYEVMSEVTGVGVESLPPRVFRFRNSQMLSMWLGESDKNADRIFDEVEKMAAIPFAGPKGKEYHLPVLCVIEEIDGMGRARGEEAIYDRILTTILQRLDPNRRGLSDRLVVFLATTNEPHIVDPALLRRIGGAVETFGRLNAEAFVEVLRKHIDGLPAAGEPGKNQKQLWKQTLEEINQWLFDEGCDEGVAELQLQGQGRTLVCHHRDFLTGALVDRSVQQAATDAWEQSINGNPKAGITSDHLRGAIRSQVQAIVNQLCPQNASHYLDLPEGVRVAAIRKVSAAKQP